MTVTGMPPPPGRARRYDWQGIAGQLRANEGSWVLVASGVTSGLSQKVREGRVPALAGLGGRLEAVERNTHYEPEHPKTRRGDLYLKWTK